jgi:glycosyltransferase involved in cell wall biosynthesis
MSFHSIKASHTGGTGNVDVLSVLNPTQSWVDYRNDRFGGVLRSHGISHESITTRNYEDVMVRLTNGKVRIVLNEVWQLRPDKMEFLARHFPDTIFISLTHGSPVHLEYVDRWAQEHVDFLRMSRDLENCYYGHVMEGLRFIGPPGSKIVTIPNVAMIPRRLAPAATKVLPEKPQILIAGRNTFIKNLTAQVAAAVILDKMHPGGIIVNLMSNCDEGAMARYMSTMTEQGIDARYHPWSPWAAYLEWMKMSIDLTFAATLTESFGLIAIESMMLGIPVMGSFAIEFLSPAYQANPQSPADMARVAMSILNDYETARRLGIIEANRVAARNESNLIDTIRGLLA